MSNKPWIEKYRPKRLCDLILPELILLKIQTMIDTRSPTSIVLCGKPGLGKTSTARVLAYELYGVQSDNYVQINASASTAKVLRDIIDGFCKTLCNETKVMILDEIDGSDSKTISMIAEQLDKYSHKVYFIMTCNAVSRIQAKLQSKAQILHFANLSSDLIAERIERICKLEEIEIESFDVLKDIGTMCGGDLRESINAAQLLSIKEKKITRKGLENGCRTPYHRIIIEIFISSLEINPMKSVRKVLWLADMGFVSQDILCSMSNSISNGFCDFLLTEQIKIAFLNVIAQYQLYITKHDSERQIVAAIAKLGLECIDNIDILTTKPDKLENK